MGLKLKILKPDVSRGPLFMGFTKIKTNKIFVNEFSDAIHKLKLTEQYLEIINKYTQIESYEK